MDTYFKDDDAIYNTCQGLCSHNVIVFRLLLYVILCALPDSLRIVVRNFRHGTETMKLCQEIVYPVNSYRISNEIYLIINTLQLNRINGFLFTFECLMRSSN